MTVASFTSAAHTGYRSKSSTTSMQRSVGAWIVIRSVALSAIAPRLPGLEAAVPRRPEAAERQPPHRREDARGLRRERARRGGSYRHHDLDRERGEQQAP